MLTSIFLVAIFVCANTNCTNSDKLKECIDSKNLDVINELHKTIEHRINNNFGTEKPYLEFISKCCDRQMDRSFFEVEKGSPLDAIIIEVLKTNLWQIDKGDTKKKSNGFSLNLPDDLKLKPPPGKKPKKDASKKKIYLNSDSEFVRCMIEEAPNKGYREHYTDHERFRIVNPELKLSAFKASNVIDCRTTYSQYFITIDIIMQNILHENDYEKYLEE